MRESGKRFRAIAVCCSAALALAGCTGGQTPNPTSIPLRPTVTADFNTGEIEELLQQMIGEGAPAAIIEIRDGNEVWSTAVGAAEVRNEVPASVDQSVRIASLTKPMVASIVLQLVDEGRLSLDEDARALIPDELAAPGPVTVRELLNHTSGAPDYVDQISQTPPTDIPALVRTPTTNEALMAMARNAAWLFTPGEGFHYSNTNYIALSMIIEQVTGNPVAEELRTRITEPLGLSHTSMPETDAMPEPSAHGYLLPWSGLRMDVTRQSPTLWSGAGGVVSTVSDIDTFMRALLLGEVVPPRLLSEMLDLNADGYGLGIQARVDSCEPGDPVRLAVGSEETAAPTAAGAPTASAGPAEATAPPEAAAPAEPSASGTLAASTVQIGEPGYVYGHLGSGFGYRALTMASPDGLRQVTISWTASSLDYANDPRLDAAYELADVALSVRC